MSNATPPQAVSLRPVHLLLMLAVNIFWGLNIIAVKFAVAEFSPLLATALRFVVLLFVCLPWLRFIKGRMTAVIILGILFGVVQFSLLFIALDRAGDASAVAIATQLGVPFSLILAIIFLGERISWWRSFGIALAFGGVVMMVFDPRVFNYLDAVWLTAIAMFIYAVTTLMMRRLTDIAPLPLQAWIAAVSIVPLFAMSWLSGDNIAGEIRVASMWAWGGIAFGAIFSSAIAHSAIHYLLQRYPVSLVTPYTLLAPVIAVVAGVMVLGDQLTWLMVIGGLVTMAGVLIISVRSAKRSSI